MKSEKDMIITKYVQVGNELRGKSFSSFDALRLSSNEIIKPLRDNWMQAVLIKNNIFANFELMSRRELAEVFEKNNVRIVDDEDGVYRIYKNEEIIGEWDNGRRIVITKRGRLSIKIRYVIV